SEPRWTRVHWQTLVHHYARAPYWAQYRDWLQDLYLGCHESSLSRINFRFLTAICERLEIGTPIHWSTEYDLPHGRTERLVELCRQVDATCYLSGPAARTYLDEGLFAHAGVDVRWMDYAGYREYPQLFPPFEHRVSILDLILNVGPQAARYLDKT